LFTKTLAAIFAVSLSILPAQAEWLWPSEPPADCPAPKSEAATGIVFTGRHAEYTNADTWYPSWGADGRLYSPFTDGSVNGVGSFSGGKNAVVGHAVITGDDPLKLQVLEPGIIPGNPAPYGGRYPAGALMHNDIWYIGTYGLANGNYGLNWPILGPCAGFHISKDLGKTWTPSPLSTEPGKALFPEPTKFKDPIKMGAPHFVDFGKNMEHSPDGKAYLVGHGTTERDLEDRKANASWITGDQIYLCRVVPSPETINNPAAYEFFAGNDADGKAIWSADFASIKPILEWDNRLGCVTITYNAPLKKYLMCVTDGGTTESKYNTGIFEADQMTGPWKLVSWMQDFGEQAYFVNIPSKFISADGRTMWLCYSANFCNHMWGRKAYRADPPGSAYAMCLQEVRLLKPGEAPPQETPLTSRANRAREAKVAASSTHKDSAVAGLTDGVAGGFPGDSANEWSSNGERDSAFFRLSWEPPVTIGKITLYDRPNDIDQVQAGLLVFSDGTTLPVGELPDDGKTGTEVTFAPKTVSWVAFFVTKVKPSTRNIGLSEITVSK
jgi:hypothetical protein